MDNISKETDYYDSCIFTEGGRKFGYGHITRCLSLYDELRVRGNRPLFILNSDDNNIKKILKERRYLVSYWYGNVKHYLNGKPYSIVDSYYANIEDYIEIQENSRCALYIDDTYRIDYPEGIIVNPSLYSDNIKYKRTPGQTYLLGKEFVILRKEFTEPLKRKVKENVKHILITMGGSDMTNITPEIINKITEIDKNENKLHVIVGQGFSNISEIIECAKNKNVQLYYNVNAKELRDIMLKCDLAISAGGQTTNELIATQLPFICVKIADNQKNNIEGFLSYGLINDYIENSEKRFDCYKLKSLYSELSKRDARQKVTCEMGKLNLRHGTKQIIDYLLGR